MATRKAFEDDPLASWQWHARLLLDTLDVQPNPAHLAIDRLQHSLGGRHVRTMVMTQNVDGLHVQASQGEGRDIAEIHGALRYARCSRGRCADRTLHRIPRRAAARILALRSPAELAHCSRCGSLLRPHVLWFDEDYGSHAAYRWRDVTRFLQTTSLFLFVGTSFSAGITEFITQSCINFSGLPAFSINPLYEEEAGGEVIQLRATAESLLPALVSAVEARLS